MTTNIETAVSRQSRGEAGVAAATAPSTPKLLSTKAEMVTKLLLRGRGATALELIAATDWQAHSVRAFLSGLRKKGRLLVREARKGGDLAYRIEAVAKVTTNMIGAAVTLTSEPSV